MKIKGVSMNIIEEGDEIYIQYSVYISDRNGNGVNISGKIKIEEESISVSDLERVFDSALSNLTKSESSIFYEEVKRNEKVG